MLKKLLTITIVLALGAQVCVSFVSSASALSGSQFKADRIIDDPFFYQSSSMSTAQVQSFLNAKVPTCDTNGTKMYNSTMTRAQYGTSKGYPPPYICLKSYSQNTPAIAGESGICGNLSAKSGRSASLIITDVANACGISPKVLLVILQKEEGLVTDEWPWPSQYQKAMGFGCPDTSGCNTSYYGFFNQVYHAARQFKLYRANPTNYNYVAGQSNKIFWQTSGGNFLNPTGNTSDPSRSGQSGCGYSMVSIQNQATAGLYNYTPYRPNQSALNNLYGSGDTCSAYGNRNFWRYYNDWFGPTLTDIVRARADTCGQTGGDCTQYVIYNGVKQGIPNNDVLTAWGIDSIPLQSYTAASLQTITTGSALSRYVKSSDSGYYYFIDNASYHLANSSAVRSTWSLTSPPASVGGKLFGILNNGGDLKPYISPIGSNTIYAVDGGVVKPIASPTIYTLWAGKNFSAMRLSTDYFSTMSTGSTIDTPLISQGGTTYILSEHAALKVSAALLPNLPSSWGTVSVSSGLFSTFSLAGNLLYSVRGNSPTIYMLDNGTKRGFPDFQTYDAFTSGTATSGISDTLLGIIPAGTPISGNIVNTGGSYYIADHGLHQIPVNLQSSYGLPATTYVTLSNNYQNIMPVNSQQATLFLGKRGSAGIYYADSGKKFPFSNPRTYQLLGGGPVTFLLQNSLNALPNGPVMRDFITDGSAKYIIDNGKKLVIPDAVTEQAWGLQNAVTINNMSVIADGGTLSQHVQLPNGLFCLIDHSTRQCAGSTAMIWLWGLTESNFKPTQSLLDEWHITDSGLLQRFATSVGGSGTVYTVAKGNLLGIKSMNNAKNLGYAGTTSQLSANTIAVLHSGTWQGYLAQDDNGGYWTLDGGVRRKIASPYYTAWLGSETPSALGNNYLSFIKPAQPISNSIKSTSNGTVYGMKTGKRYGIPSPAVYSASGLDPYTLITPSLLESIPYGGVWSN